MRFVKLEFGRLSIPEKIQKARNIVLKMTGNTNFTTPVPALSAITTAIGKLETSHENAMDGGQSKKAAMKVDEKALDVLMAQLAAYVQDASLGDELKILSSGMEVKALPSAPQPLTAPLDARALINGVVGEAQLRWKPVKGAKSYVVERTTTPNDEATWTIFDVSTRGSLHVRGLTSMSVMWFRVAALGAKGRSGFSDPFKATIL